jgi:asparagine synthetase B (glutamine-hydrolysing)
MLPDDLRPSPLEIACGLVVSNTPATDRLEIDRRRRPRDVFDDALRRALLRPPCLVCFSGGRDSSAVLAAATALARKEGHPLPVAVTYRFPDAPGSNENEWQEEVARHLRLSDWERLTITDELDSVGPVAQRVFRRHGVVWPFNAHFHLPLMERAAGGSLLTGVGGDELFGTEQWWAARAVLAGRRRPRLRDVRSVGLAISPWPVRHHVLSRRPPVRFPWLHPEVEEAITRQRAEWTARTPLPWSGAIGWWWRSRARAVLAGTFDALAAGAGTNIVQPFLERSVIASAAGNFGAAGPSSRSAAMRELFGDVLPEAVLVRRSKAFFDDAFFSTHSRSFARSWAGAGVDPALVDAERLAATWQDARPDPRTLLLLQVVWMASAGALPNEKEM